MADFTPISLVKRKKTLGSSLISFVVSFGGIFEVGLVIFVWFIVFQTNLDLSGLNLPDMVSYFLIGNIISMATGYLAEKVMSYDLARDEAKMLVLYPKQYLKRVLLKELSKYLLPFLLIGIAYFVILHIFIEDFEVNLAPHYLIVIFLMVALAFLTEFLIAYIFQMIIFWTIQAKAAYDILLRLKKILAGNYFPLSLLPPMFISTSLALPFVYSFYVPTELYLKKISFRQGLIGLAIQICWIIILYALIRIIWLIKSERKKT